MSNSAVVENKRCTPLTSGSQMHVNVICLERAKGETAAATLTSVMWDFVHHRHVFDTYNPFHICAVC